MEDQYEVLGDLLGMCLTGYWGRFYDLDEDIGGSWAGVCHPTLFPRALTLGLPTSSASISLPAAEFCDSTCWYFFNDYTSEWQNGYGEIPGAVLGSWSTDAGPILPTGYEIDGDSSRWFAPMTSWHCGGLPLSFFFFQ